MANVLKRKPAEENRSYASKGLASIRCGKDVAKITFLGKDKRGEPILWDNGETSKKFDKDDLPKTFVFEPHTEGEYYVCSSFDKSEVFAIGPWEGSFDMKVVDFSRPEKDADPAPFERSGKDKKTGKEYHGLWFKAQWKIVEKGEFKNCIVIQQHVYQSETAGFEEDEDGMTQWRGQTDSERAVWQPRLEKFCEAHNAVDEPIAWAENDGNILPELLERVLNAPIQVHRMKVEKGEVVGFADTHGKRKLSEEPNPFGEEELEESESVEKADEVDEEFPPKKSAPAKETKKHAVKKIKKQDEDDEDL